jgi:hypothetical protein
MNVGKLPERDRKIILWSIVILLGVILFLWWGRSVAEKLKDFSSPQIPKELRDSVRETTSTLELPSFDIKIPGEALPTLQEEINNGKPEE